MLPPRHAWAVAAFLVAAIATAAATTQAPPSFATLTAGAGASASAGPAAFSADAHAGARVAEPDRPAAPAMPDAGSILSSGDEPPSNGTQPPSNQTPSNHTRPPSNETPRDPPRPPPGNHTPPGNHSRPPTNQTPSNHTPPQRPPPVSNNTTVMMHALAPRSQRATGDAGVPVHFNLTLTNADTVSRHFVLSASAPSRWSVALSPSNVTLGPGESVPVSGAITTPPLLGAEGTVAVTARAGNATDTAYVETCVRGAVLDPCAPPPRPPPSNETRPPPNGTRPGNGTQPPPSNSTQPHQDPAPSSNETSSPPPQSHGNHTSSGNRTQESPSNGTGAPASRPPRSAGTTAEIWMNVQARVGDDEGDPSPPDGPGAA